MATWTNVPNTVLEPGDPIRSVDIIAIKENIIALSEGASGAPKILTAAINNGAVTVEKFASGAVLSVTAGGSVGAVGTYCEATGTSQPTLTVGSTKAGSTLQKRDTSGTRVSMGFSGTWRNMGPNEDGGFMTNLYLRIS